MLCRRSFRISETKRTCLTGRNEELAVVGERDSCELVVCIVRVAGMLIYSVVYLVVYEIRR